MNDFGSVVCGRQNTPYQAPVSVDIRLIRDTNLSVLGLSFLLLLLLLLQRLRFRAGVGAGKINPTPKARVKRVFTGKEA